MPEPKVSPASPLLTNGTNDLMQIPTLGFLNGKPQGNDAFAFILEIPQGAI